MDHQLAHISQTIISSLSIRKITLVFFACACVHACVHVYVYIYTYLAGNESPGSAQMLYK